MANVANPLLNKPWYVCVPESQRQFIADFSAEATKIKQLKTELKQQKKALDKLKLKKSRIVISHSASARKYKHIVHAARKQLAARSALELEDAFLPIADK